MRVVPALIGVAVACLVIRTFVAVGLITPVVVVGVSMAPGLNEGERVSVDRVSLAWRALERWERVVLHRPDNANQLAIKRVVGLPSERLELIEGDAWANGQRLRKPLRQQLALRQLVHRESEAESRWTPEPGSDATFRAGVWRLDATSTPQAIVYRHPGDGVIRDDLAINTEVTRRLNPVADLMVTATIERSRDAEVEFKIERAGQTVRLLMEENTWRLDGSAAAATGYEEIARGRLAEGLASPALLTFSLFDKQATLAFGEEVVVAEPLPFDGQSIRRPQRIAVRVASGGATLRELTVWRDVYYEPRLVDLAPKRGWRIGPERLFVIGDNQAVSLDSRSWGGAPAGVPLRLLVGRVAGGP